MDHGLGKRSVSPHAEIDPHPGTTLPVAHSPVDMPAGCIDEVEQLVLCDVVTFIIRRIAGSRNTHRASVRSRLVRNGLHLLCAVRVVSGTRMRIVLVQVGEDLRVSEVWRHSRRRSADRRSEPFPFPCPPMAGARLPLNPGEP
jgi:hypothetical protein